MRLLLPLLLLPLLLPPGGAWVRRQRPKREPRYGDLRLVDGATDNEGSVVIFKGYDWGTICDDGWGLQEAKVVCRQLGLGEPREALPGNVFHTEGFPMFLDDLECNGTEANLTECPHFYDWGQHDCHSVSEIAGVRCHIRPKETERFPKWNPLGVENHSKTKLISMQKIKFKVSFHPVANASYGNYIVATVRGRSGGVCPDDFTLVEANVFCREMGLGFGKYIHEVDFLPPAVPRRHTLRVGLCRGNESALFECASYARSRGVDCDSQRTVAVVCDTALSDLVPDLPTLQSSAYLAQLPMWLLSCSMEERCLSETAMSMVERRSPYVWQYLKRNLLRFSSIIANEGTADFLPLDPIETWQWHACHLHYHSMKLFARYELVDERKYVRAAGHKASFCLEDNECKDPRSRKFRCSNTEHNTGTQGISPGCKDIYLHNFDCQWIDITDLPYGSYQFRIVINPEFKVGELDFFNNAIVCDMKYFATAAFLRNCRFIHPHDL